MSTRMPLFPLNTVLFPGMPLSLHIFEDRYKQMMNACISEKIPFGVVLISEGVEALGPLANPHLMGCSARITQVQPLGQGRMNLVAVGEERFRVLNLDRDSQQYLVGEVEMEPMAGSAQAKLAGIGGRLRDRVIRYLEILSEAGDVQFDPEQIPTDALKLANFAAFLVRVEPDEKQRLLEFGSELAFLGAVNSLYSRENALLETMIAQSQREEEGGNPGPFSLN